MNAHHQPTLLYDGECPFCSKAVARLRRWDRTDRLKFLPASSPEGSRLLAGLPPEADPSRTVILVLHDRTLVRSEAVLEVVRIVGGWRAALARVIRWVPCYWRDAVYDLVARHRHRQSLFQLAEKKPEAE